QLVLLRQTLGRLHVAQVPRCQASSADQASHIMWVPLDVDVNALLSRWRWWASGCVGCIGVLKDWLVDAVAATLVQKGASLTEEILTKTMPHPARRLSLEMEARAGEHKVALHESESAKQFQALLKKLAKAATG